MFNLVVWVVSEEYFDDIWSRLEVFLSRIDGNSRADVSQSTSIFRIGWLLYNHLLGIDVAFDTEAHCAHKQTFPGIEVKDHGVVVGLVGDEDRKGDEYARGKCFSEPYGPDAVSRHLGSCVVEDVEYDVDEYGGNDGDT